MIDSWRQWRASTRIKEGDGRTLRPFRWWQQPVRALFWLSPSQDDERRTTYAVDVRHWANLAPEKVKAHLYIDGAHRFESRLPAVFPVESGVIEVRMSAYGVRRCHYVSGAGAEHQLTADPTSAEGRRARLDRDRPALSRLIGVLSVVTLLVGVGLNLLQLAEPLSQVPPIAESVGTFDSPVDLPLWLNIALGLAALVASMERSLRLRHHPLLDKAGL